MNLLLLEELEKDNSITLGRGNIISKEEMQQCPGDFPVYSSSATKNGEFGRYGKYMFEDERITWSIDGGGRLFYRNNHKYSVTNVCGWLKVNNPNFSTKFIYYCLIFQWSHLKFDYTYKAHPSVIKKMYKIPVIDLPTQLKIVDELDKINQNIENETNAFEYYEELIKSRFIEMFGNNHTNEFRFPRYFLGDITYKITDGKHAGCKIVENSDYYFIGAREVNNGKIEYENAPHISYEEFIKDYKRCDLQLDDFIIVNTGATIGKSAIISDQRATRTLLQKSVALIRCNTKIIKPLFLKYCYAVNKQLYLVENSTAQPNLLLSAIRQTSIAIPPIELQNEFAEFVKLTDKLKFIAQKRIDLYTELLNKKMDEYFN